MEPGGTGIDGGHFGFQLEFPVKPRGQLQKENDEKFLQMLKDQRRDGKVTDHGLYEMLQEYMIENETLR